MNFRIGQGYDVHSFGEGEFVTLGGVEIPHDRGINAHSDGDVVIHALCDAIYGAVAQGDIGQHFPPSDQEWKDAPSELFLKHACKTLKAQGYALSNTDMTVIAEAPKISMHAQKIVKNLALIMEIQQDQISLKATTHEKIGSLGRKEGIAALALVLVYKV